MLFVRIKLLRIQSLPVRTGVHDVGAGDNIRYIRVDNIGFVADNKMEI